MLLVILAIWFGYKKARYTGRNPFLWAAICGGTFIGVQLLVGVGFGVAIALGIEFWGWSESLHDTLSWAISLVAIVISIAALYLLFRFLDRVPQEEPNVAPPPPPTFDRDE